MEIGGIIKAWNAQHGAQLPLSVEVLDATFFSWPADKRFIIQGAQSTTFCKLDDGVLRLYLAVANSPKTLDKACQEMVLALDEKAKSLGVQRVTFGGGDRHLFPGIPLFRGQKKWLEFFSPSGGEVIDFEGSLEVLTEKLSYIEPCGELRLPRDPRERKGLIEFVEHEFNGRWAREATEDHRSGHGEHYFGYYVEGELVGYVRLYGWNQGYWAPGVYFSKPASGMGGLGPIGVAYSQRGKGYGSEILKLSWEVLKQKECKDVRIDWTTEKNFYERAGLRVAQIYQPAVRHC